MENFEVLADFISLVDFSPFFLDEHWHSNTLLKSSLRGKFENVLRITQIL